MIRLNHHIGRRGDEDSSPEDGVVAGQNGSSTVKRPNAGMLNTLSVTTHARDQAGETCRRSRSDRHGGVCAKRMANSTRLFLDPLAAGRCG